MPEPGLLAALADLCGIAGEYHDIWRRPHPTSDDTRRELLAAMGVAATTPEAARAALAEREERPWRGVLPPVIVAREPLATLAIPLAVPARLVERRWLAVIETETGETIEEPFTPRELGTDGERRIDGETVVRRTLSLAARPAPGYHDLRVEPPAGGPAGRSRLILAPARGHVPEAIEAGRRAWGPAAQLYALRSARNWGIGDFTDLAALIALVGAGGAGLVGLNPLHALFPRNPRHASPYSPSSRSFLNPLYLDVEAIPDFAECEEARSAALEPAFRAAAAGLRAAEHVDYAAVARVKHEMFERLWRHFRVRHLDGGTPRSRAFGEFVRRRGTALEDFGVFGALQEELDRDDWRVWPGAFRRPDSTAVARFARERRDRVGLHAYLQWQCDEQLGAAARACSEAGWPIGLYVDLAVGADRAGFDAWRDQDTLALDAGLGAPPDDFNPLGQSWGLPPYVPERLRDAAYAPFVECLRASMRHAGALRVDHVMGLMRAFWVPPGARPALGAYVRYPFADLLGILTLESQRQRCLVVGEDLGTVPDEVREALAPAAVYSYRLLYFSHGDADFTPPAGYPRQALVAVTTHDLPTLAGYWLGRDLDVRAELGLFPDDAAEAAARLARERDRRRLLAALEREGLVPPHAGAEPPREMTPELAAAIHRFLGRTPCALLAFQLEDVLLETEQANLPGTTDQHPNWSRKLSEDLATLARDVRLALLVELLRAERG